MTMIEQGSAEWLALRVGKVTASRMADLTARTKSGWGASRANYMADLIAERLTGVPAEHYINGAMQWGIDTEPEARAAYQFETGTLVQPASFVPHPTIAMSGASPDGAVGDKGLLECKCPNTATHIDTLLGQAVPAKYICQMQWQMACAGRQWCDFVSFDPRMPESMQLWIRRISRDNAMIATLEAQVIEFIAELDEKVNALRTLYEPTAAAA